MMAKLLLFSILVGVLFQSGLSENKQPLKRDIDQDAFCNIYLYDSKTGDVWDEMKARENIHLVKYNLVFIEYLQENLTDPLRNVNGSNFYKLDNWYQAFTPKGLKLLPLTLHYDADFLDLLSLGVKELDVLVVDGPGKCLLELSHQSKFSTLLTFMTTHFPYDEGMWRYLNGPYCHQKIERNDTKGRFVYECCKNDKDKGKDCITVEETDHIKCFYFAILIIKIVFFLVCPWIIQILFFQKSLERINYTVPISDPGLKKTMLIKRVNSEYETINRSSKYSRPKPMQQFSNFRRLVKPIPSDEIVSVNFRRLDVVVDHNELMSKNESPVQLLQYLYANLIRCDCTKSDPFRTCCGESLVGSWSPSFLWCKLQKKCETNNSCRECCPWLAIFRCLGYILFIAAIPVLFYLRAIVFYTFEKEEQEDKYDFLDEQGLNVDDVRAITQILASHFCYLGLILCYLISFIAFAVLRTLFQKQVDSVVNKSITDFRNVNRFECFRMITAHAVLPFEKFGIFGIIVGAFYWPLAIPIAILLTIFYCIPVLYITGRLLFQDRPGCLESSSSSAKSQNAHSISRGVSSLASCFLLDFISPSRNDGADGQEEKTQKARTLLCCTFSFKKIISFFKNLLVGFLLVVVILSFCVMYAESVGFMVEVFFLFFLGALTYNTVIYFIFGCFMVLHLCLALHFVKRRYFLYSKRLFKSIQLKLQKDILEKVMRNKICKENYAFKYFGTGDTKEHGSTDTNCNEFTDNTKAKKYCSSHIPIEGEREEIDNIEYLSGHLHWTVNSLVLFIDENDHMYMPRNLFWMTCDLGTVDSPGPLWKTLIMTFTVLLLSMFYLGLLLVMFLSVEVNGMSNVMQDFIFFACSCVPSIAYLAFQCCMQQKSSEYIVGEKILYLIKSYRRSWPVSDLVFENPESPRQRAADSRSRFAGDNYGLDSSVNPQLQNDYCESRVMSSEHQMPLKVDLLITLKDEEARDGIMRGSMVSNGSAHSLNSITQTSPQEVLLRRGPAQPNTNAVPNIQGANLMQRPLLSSAADNASSDSFPAIEIELNDLKIGLDDQTTI